MLGIMREINGAALILAGLALTLFFPSIAATLLTRVKTKNSREAVPEKALP